MGFHMYFRGMERGRNEKTLIANCQCEFHQILTFPSILFPRKVAQVEQTHGTTVDYRYNDA